MPDPRVFLPVLYVVDVKFDPDADPQFTFDGMGPGNKLTVKSGMATIFLRLQPPQGGPHVLKFSDSPITWFGDPAPACISVQRNSDTQVTIVDYNTNTDPESDVYEFEVSVWYDGVGYMSQDPTILNAEVPPTSGEGHGGQHGAEGRPALRAV